MFGLLISGRPINASPEVLSQTQYVFRIPSNPPFTHLALFMLPGQSLPPDVGATVWVQIPPATEFRLLGALAETKQTAIFKINMGASPGGMLAKDEEGDVMVDEDTAGIASQGQQQQAEIVIGVSIEPAAQVESQLAGLKAGAMGAGSTASAAPSNSLVKAGQGQATLTTKVLAQRIIGNAFEYLASFGDNVPLKAFRDWWTKFERKLELDPGFLEREQG